MTAIAAGKIVAGQDSGGIYGDTELLESLVDEVNGTLGRLATLGLQVNQVGEISVGDGLNAEVESLIHLLPQEQMEDIARRVRSIESLLLHAAQ
ncbi:MAG: hypothetical protein HQL72_09515 [Magnetococcales bacterium]|nr:hypothetical protein [Magnetococcales bacterium]